MVEEDDALSAIDALILVEDWEGAAIVERAYASRLELLGGDADYRLELAAGYLTRIPACDTTFLIAAHQAYRAATTASTPACSKSPPK